MKKHNLTKQILVVDDSSFTRYTIIEILKEIGDWDFIEAEDGQKALDLLEIHKPDCILLDLLMPIVGGIEVLEKMQNKGYNSPVIVFTADIQDTTRKKCLDLGATDVINKPLEAEILVNSIMKVINS